MFGTTFQDNIHVSTCIKIHQSINHHKGFNSGNIFLVFWIFIISLLRVPHIFNQHSNIDRTQGRQAFQVSESTTLISKFHNGQALPSTPASFPPVCQELAAGGRGGLPGFERWIQTYVSAVVRTHAWPLMHHGPKSGSFVIISRQPWLVGPWRPCWTVGALLLLHPSALQQLCNVIPIQIWKRFWTEKWGLPTSNCHLNECCLWSQFFFQKFGSCSTKAESSFNPESIDISKENVMVFNPDSNFFRGRHTLCQRALTTLGLHLRILPAFDSQDAEFWSWPNSQLTLNFFYNISTLRRWAPVLLDRCACIFGDDFVKNKIRLLSANNWNQLQEFWFFFPYEVPAHGASAICLEEHSAFDRHGQCCVKLPKTAGESTLVWHGDLMHLFSNLACQQLFS